jgi:hypothetical protein
MMLSPSHDIAPGINMLRTCRQVYHEAVGILYSSNSFTISMDLHRHNRTMQQLDTAADFVHRLGSQAALLKNVNIDIDPLCSPMCVEHPYDDDEQIDILPLVRVLWSGKLSGCNMKLIHTGRELDPCVYYDYYRDEMSRICTADLLDATVHAIGTEDLLELVKYARSDRILANIWVRRDLTQGWVAYEGSSLKHHGYERDPGQVEKPFMIIKTEQGGLAGLQYGHWRYASHLHRMPEFYHRRILMDALQVDHEVIFNLDRRTTQGLDFGLLHSCPDTRLHMRQFHGSRNQVALHMATTEHQGSFSDWASLRIWLNESISKMYPRHDIAVTTESKATIVLSFNPPSSKPQMEVRVDIVNFIRLTYELHPQTVVRMAVIHEVNGSRHTEEPSVSLEELRKDCFLLISVLLEQQPHRAGQNSPEIWINGEGHVIEAIYPRSDTVDQVTIPNPHTSLGSEENTTIGLQYASTLDVRHRPKGRLREIDIGSRYRRHNNALNENSSLRSTWE